MTDGHLLESCIDGVTTLTFNRPDRLNAISAPMFERLLDILERIAADNTVGAVVLAGAGRAFSAGGDVGEMANRGSAETPEDAVRTLRRRMEIVRLLHEMPKPTLACVQGPAAGAGMCLAIACDMRIASPSATFTTAFAKVGYSGDYGGSYFLPRLVGAAKARELYFTASSVNAQEAQRIGLVNRVVEQAELAGITHAMAAALAGGPRLALAQMKRNLNLAGGSGLPALLDLEAEGQIRCRLTEDHREAARAFMEKRPPVFKGR
ncbi:MAG: enoyl-CoA hydratase [Pseudomonadota bacterium]